MNIYAAKAAYKSMDRSRNPKDLTDEEIRALMETVILLGSSLEDAEERIKELEGKLKQPNIKPASEGNQETEENEVEEKSEPKTRGKSKEKKFENFEANETIILDKFAETLPEDAVFKGYETKYCIDVQLVTRKIEFKRVEYYSPSLNKSFYADIPAGYDGQYGPGVKSLIHALSTASNLTRANMVGLFKALNIPISKATVVNISTKELDEIKQEHLEAFVASVESSSITHIDDTGARHEGRNCSTTVVSTDSVALFDTNESKSRLNAINVLGGGQGLKFLIDDDAIEYIKNHRIKEFNANKVKTLGNRIVESEEELELELNRLNLTGKGTQRTIKEALALSYLKNYGPRHRALMSDAAKQFIDLFEDHSNCWFHEIKHYKDFTVVNDLEKEELARVRKSFKDFFQGLKAYKLSPSEELAKELEDKFDKLVTQDLKNPALTNQLKQTLQRKDLLLLVLKLPDIPLTNNVVERDIRKEVQKRKISFGTRSTGGKKARDLMMSLAITCSKLDVSIIEFLLDRLQKLNQIPSLSEIVGARASPSLT